VQIYHRHGWDLSPREAIALQIALRQEVNLHDELPPIITRVAGVDVGFEQGGTVTRAAVVVLDYPSLSLIESRIARQSTRFPYIPGLLSFRELPAILSALEVLEILPELILADGQGIAHPRRLGIASHLGVLTGIPTIGVGKTRLLGDHSEVPEHRGEWTPLMDKEDCVGAVLRTRAGVKPIYVSAGHKISLNTAVNWVMNCTGRYRLPETTRLAHRACSQLI